jgi:hypothetical protein
MKASPFLLLALGAASASACALFQYCHCLNSDGSANDDATNATCIIEGPPNSIQENPTNSILECYYGGYPNGYISNVQFKQWCWNSGATADNAQSCRGN